MKDEKGMRWCNPPVEGTGYGNLSAHEIEEHEDGTISVTPSILITLPQGDKPSIELYHGYLKHGVWEP
jgi:hypothetical protein